MKQAQKKKTKKKQLSTEVTEGIGASAPQINNPFPICSSEIVKVINTSLTQAPSEMIWGTGLSKQLPQAAFHGG